jgi:hypothetical protein
LKLKNLIKRRKEGAYSIDLIHLIYFSLPSEGGREFRIIPRSGSKNFKIKKMNMKKIYTLLLGFGVALNVVAQMQVSQGTEINVNAIPKPGYRFIQWSDGNIENPRSITVMDNVDLVAEFYYNDYTLTTQVNSVERGSVTSGESIQYTQTKELTATPNYGYAFKNWTLSGTESSLSATTSNPTIFTM